MTNGFTHKFVGGLTGLGVVPAEQDKEQPANPLLAIGTGAPFAKLPDILKPTANPSHRQFCHSLVVLAAVGYGVKKVYEWKPEDRAGGFRRTVGLVLGLGISHTYCLMGLRLVLPL